MFLLCTNLLYIGMLRNDSVIGVCIIMFLLCTNLLYIGMLRNDSVIGDPLYTVPLYSDDDKDYSLCYEVYGRTNATFNLVSDTCVTVNAHYGPMNNLEQGNIINKVGVQAVGSSQEKSCHNILVQLEGCSASVQRSVDNSSLDIPLGGRYDEDGVTVRRFSNRVRIAVPNCENVMLVMYVICQKVSDQEMIKFVITRGLNLRPSSHGLIGTNIYSIMHVASCTCFLMT